MSPPNDECQSPPSDGECDRDLLRANYGNDAAVRLVERDEYYEVVTRCDVFRSFRACRLKNSFLYRATATNNRRRNIFPDVSDDLAYLKLTPLLKASECLISAFRFSSTQTIASIPIHSRFRAALFGRRCGGETSRCSNWAARQTSIDALQPLNASHQSQQLCGARPWQVIYRAPHKDLP